MPEKRESTSRNADEADDTSFVLVYQWIVTWQARLIVQEDRLEPLAIPLPQLRRHRSRRQEHPVVQLGHLVDVRTFSAPPAEIADIPFALIGGVFDLRTPQAVAALIEACRQVEAETGDDVVLIVIDTISRAMAGGDENSSKDMGAIVAATSRLQAETKAHVLWIHHMPQDGAERLRGHGALLGAMDTTVHVESGDVKSATVVKANDSEEGEKVVFTLESVTIGPETTAPVVVPADPALAQPTGTKRRLSPRSRRAFGGPERGNHQSRPACSHRSPTSGRHQDGNAGSVAG